MWPDCRPCFNFNSLEDNFFHFCHTSLPQPEKRQIYQIGVIKLESYFFHIGGAYVILADIENKFTQTMS